MCNIQCNFCKRSLNKDEIRPGVTSRIVRPEEAPGLLDKALQLVPEISVVGIAGPGDTLASDNAIDTFKLLDESHPEILKCLSTNGLLLEKRIGELVEVKLSSLTVTVNGVDPSVVKHIVSSVVWEGRVLRGEEGAQRLIQQQLAGLRLASRAGLTIKVNYVLIPGVNTDRVVETADAVKEAGASIFNIIPLIPQHRFANTTAPNCDELSKARQEAQARLRVFRNCQHCRADACGVLGKKDFARELYGDVQVQETFSHG